MLFSEETLPNRKHVFATKTLAFPIAAVIQALVSLQVSLAVIDQSRRTRGGMVESHASGSHDRFYRFARASPGRTGPGGAEDLLANFVFIRQCERARCHGHYHRLMDIRRCGSKDL